MDALWYLTRLGIEDNHIWSDRSCQSELISYFMALHERSVRQPFIALLNNLNVQQKCLLRQIFLFAIHMYDEYDKKKIGFHKTLGGSPMIFFPS